MSDKPSAMAVKAACNWIVKMPHHGLNEYEKCCNELASIIDRAFADKIAAGDALCDTLTAIFKSDDEHTMPLVAPSVRAFVGKHLIEWKSL